MNMPFMNRILILGIVAFIMIVGVALPTTSQAWNRDTHQRITEFAYAYLKAYSICGDTSIADQDSYNDIFDACADTMPTAAQGAGYTCGCAQDQCAENCGKFKGSERYLCVKLCADSQASSKPTGCVIEQQCAEPYYWDPGASDLITADICAPQAYEQTHILWSERCTALASVFNPLGISSAEAKKTVQFYQNFQSTACPLASYGYKSEPDCDWVVETDDGSYGLREPNDAQSLKDWNVSPFENTLVGDGLDEEFELKNRLYRSMTGSLLTTTNWVEADPNSVKLDLTGTIIGFHAATPDKFQDLWARYQLFPLMDDFFTTAAEVAVGAAGGSLAALAAAGGVAMCLISCPITIFFGKCDDCFSGTYDAVKDILDNTADIIEDLEESHIMPGWGSHNIFGENLSSTFHFIDADDPSFYFDDMDGWETKEAFGPLGWIYLQLSRLGYALNLFEMRIDYQKSKTSLENYNIQYSDDGMGDSSGRSVFYWERAGFVNQVMPPIDNLAYYWWHKWFQGRISGKAEIQTGIGEYGLMPLGAVLHAVQDATQPFHAWGVTAQGHLPYEDQVSNNLDPTLSNYRNVSDPNFFIDLTTDEGEKKFLTSVRLQLVSVYLSGIGQTNISCPEPCYRLLRPRNLIHWLAERSAEADWNLEWFDDQPALSPWDYSFTHEYTRQTAIPSAIAASIAVLYEASRDPAQYAQVMKLALASFEHEGPVPNGMQAMSYQEIPNDYSSVEPSWACATASVRGAQAVQKYFLNQMSGEDLLTIAFAEKTRCELASAGLPVPPNTKLDELGSYQSERLRIMTAWLEHGDSAVVEQELACLYANGPNELPIGARNRFQERCDGLLDSDGDGVFDQDDACMTAESLLEQNYSVASNGCVFNHATTYLPPHNPFQPGAIREVLP